MQHRNRVHRPRVGDHYVPGPHAPIPVVWGINKVLGFAFGGVKITGYEKGVVHFKWDKGTRGSLPLMKFLEHFHPVTRDPRIIGHLAYKGNALYRMVLGGGDASP